MKNAKTLQSQYSANETADKLVNYIEQEDWHIFAQINHAEEAGKVGLDLNPTKVILFGNPKIGTHLMQDAQTAAIDLPMKVLVMADENGKVQLVYNDMKWLKERHNLTDDKTVQQIADLVEKVCKKAAE